ncbi:hypothetical protein SynSYN20_01140 [Synechococcus sp. SYN20]|nr:hypothetical protein SynSYN20_01140 [Synechococcus sp. SYN20]
MKKLWKGSLRLIFGIGRSREGLHAHKLVLSISAQTNLAAISPSNS